MQKGRLIVIKTGKQNKNLRSRRKNNLLLDTAPFQVKEAYKSARTNIMFSLSEKSCKKIIITSSFPKEGKSTTCANLAITFAQTGAKVLIIDADIRKPRMHKMFGAPHNIGVTNVLAGNSSVEEAIIKTGYDNLDLLIAGHIPPNPAEMLSSMAMSNLLDVLSGKYEYIFIDTPPVNVVTDTLILSKKVSGVFMVVRIGLTDHKALKESVSKLEFANAKPLGFILNDVDVANNSYKYNYKKYTYKKYRYMDEDYK